MRGVLLILIVAAQLWLGAPSRAAIRWLAAGWVVLVLGHYADVTTPALYGRDINLYWDVRYMPDVAAMIARAAPLWLIVGVVAAVAAVLALLYVVFRWALRRVAAAAFDPKERAPIVMAGRRWWSACSSAQQLGWHFETEPVFATPVVRDLRAPGAAGRRGAERVAHARAEPADGRRPGAGARTRTSS